MSGTPPLGVPGFCANCEDYADRLVTTGDRALCPSCASGSSTATIGYTDLSSYQCGCLLYELAAIGSLEERTGLCTECIRAVKRSQRIDLDAPDAPEEFSARFPGDRGVLDL